MKEERVIFKSGGYDIVGLVSFPKKIPAPGVILFHGLTNSKNDCPLINEMVKSLQENGMATFRFDFYGSGESPGEMKDKTFDIMIQNAKDAINFFLSTGKISSLGLWGRSMGGTTVTLVGNDPRVKASVIASGVVMLENDMKERFLTLRKRAQSGEKLPGTGKFKGEFDLGKGWFDCLEGLDEKIEKNLKKLNTVLVLHTTPDKKSPLANGTKIINLVHEPKKIIIFEGVDHDYVDVEEKAVEHAKNWFGTYLS